MVVRVVVDTRVHVYVRMCVCVCVCVVWANIRLTRGFTHVLLCLNKACVLHVCVVVCVQHVCFVFKS